MPILKKTALIIFTSSLLFLIIDCSKANGLLLSISKDSITTPPSFSDLYSPDKPDNTTDCPDFIRGYENITLGIRTGICTLFDPQSIGVGYGADTRIKLAQHWNLECYGDYFTTNISNLGYRHALCFGGSLLYYWVERPLEKHRFTPFLLSGISFDDNTIRSNEIYTPQYRVEDVSPWFNIGYGVHYNITSRLDITLEGYYALPLSTHPVSDIISNGNIKYMVVVTKSGFNEGGIFILLSLNYKLF